jgi:hypothetical protein
VKSVSWELTPVFSTSNISVQCELVEEVEWLQRPWQRIVACLCFGADVSLFSPPKLCTCAAVTLPHNEQSTKRVTSLEWFGLKGLMVGGAAVFLLCGVHCCASALAVVSYGLVFARVRVQTSRRVKSANYRQQRAPNK